MENIYIHLDSGKNDIVGARAPMTYDANDAAKLQDYLDMTISPPSGPIELIHPTKESLTRAQEVFERTTDEMAAKANALAGPPDMCGCPCHLPDVVMMHFINCCEVCPKCEQRIIRDKFSKHSCEGK